MPIKHARITRATHASASMSRWPIAIGLILVLASLVSSCEVRSQGPGRAATNAEEAFSAQFGLEGLDNQIDLELVSQGSSFINGERIQLLVANRSEKAVWFPPGYGSRLFIRQSSEGAWIEIDNQVTYIGEGDLLEPRGSPSGNWAAVVTVSADELPLDGAELLRIVTTGRVATGGSISDTYTSSYVDIALTP